MWSLVATVLALFKSLGDLASKAFDYFSRKEAIDEGKTIANAEMAEKDQDIEDEQTKILIEDRTKDDVINKMEKGEF